MVKQTVVKVVLVLLLFLAPPLVATVMGAGMTAMQPIPATHQLVCGVTPFPPCS